MRPLFSRKRGRHGSEPEQVQEKSESLGHSDQSLSVPSESKRFAHLGVLADVERVQEVEPERW